MTADTLTGPRLTGALEDYLETIYRLLRTQPFARVRDIARERDVKAGSVTPAMKRLADLGLVKYVQREYVTLTTDGEQAARRVYARHQLLRRFFTEVLQMAAADAEREACAIEHSLSDEAMDRMTRFFEFLSACPNSPPDFLTRFQGCSRVHDDVAPCDNHCVGATAPGAGGDDAAPVSLLDLPPGGSGRVTQVVATGAVRQRLLDMGLLPDALVRVERVAPGGEPIWIHLDGGQLALRRREAEAVRIDADEA